jgi:hypothetical protein
MSMGALIGVGFIVIIFVVIGLLVTIIGLFFGNIILFDSVAFAILASVLSHNLWNVHPALCILIGIALCIGLYFLQRTTAGFWIIGGALSLLWGFIFSMIAYELSHQDMIWRYVVFGLGTLLMIGLHIRARKRIT